MLPSPGTMDEIGNVLGAIVSDLAYVFRKLSVLYSEPVRMLKLLQVCQDIR